jgi:hypothetical protein
MRPAAQPVAAQRDPLQISYPQLVGSGVDNLGQHVNDTFLFSAVHPNVAWLWFTDGGPPQPSAPSVLGCRTLSPVSTHAKTTAVLNK